MIDFLVQQELLLNCVLNVEFFSKASILFTFRAEARGTRCQQATVEQRECLCGTMQDLLLQ